MYYSQLVLTFDPHWKGSMFDDPMVHMYMYMLYIQMACLCKHPPPFLARQFQAPMGAYSREYSTRL